MSTTASSLLDSALATVAEGISVTPLFGKGGGFKWKQFQTRLPTEYELRRAFTANGHGEPTGYAAIFCKATWQANPYLCMLEIEARHREEAEPWLDVHLPGWRNGQLVESGAGSLHIYLMSPEPIKKKDYAWGEVRGEDHLGVMPESIHPETGKPYRWLHQGQPQRINPYSLPLPGLSPEKRAYKNFAEGVIHEHEGRNVALISLGGLLRGTGGFDIPLIEVVLRAVNQERCKPPLPEEDLAAMLNQISGYEPGDYIKNILRGLSGASVGSSRRASLGVENCALRNPHFREASVSIVDGLKEIDKAVSEDKADAEGFVQFPAIRISKKSGLPPNTVLRHLKLAVDAGIIDKRKEPLEKRHSVDFSTGEIENRFIRRVSYKFRNPGSLDDQLRRVATYKPPKGKERKRGAAAPRCPDHPDEKLIHYYECPKCHKKYKPTK